jgi:hypothetical protein
MSGGGALPVIVRKPSRACADMTGNADGSVRLFTLPHLDRPPVAMMWQEE